MPEPTYSTFHDDGHYSIKVGVTLSCMRPCSQVVNYLNWQPLTGEDNPDSEEQLNASVFSNNVAVHNEAASSQEKKVPSLKIRLTDCVLQSHFILILL